MLRCPASIASEDQLLHQPRLTRHDLRVGAVG